MCRIVSTRLFIVLVALTLVSCSSTSNLKPGNALPGVGLGAANDSVLLSWTENGTLARMLPQGTRVNLLASYDTQFGPVTNEVVSMSQVRPGFNGIELKLADSLRFIPAGRVCLRLAIGRRPIPIRIAQFSESSSGFYYDEWATHALSNSEEALLQAQLATVTTNIRNFSQPDENFESWKRENAISSPSECGSITVPEQQKRPNTALDGKEKAAAVKRQCIALYNEYSGKGYLPNIASIVDAFPAQNRYRATANRIKQDFAKYSPGRVYFPYSNLPIDTATIWSLGDWKNGIPEVSAKLVIEAYEACEAEANTRFDESLQDWLDVTNPQTVAERIEPMRKLCRARFSRNEERLNKLNELKLVKTDVERKMTALSASVAQALPSKKLLIPHACPAETSTRGY